MYCFLFRFAIFCLIILLSVGCIAQPKNTARQLTPEELALHAQIAEKLRNNILGMSNQQSQTRYSVAPQPVLNPVYFSEQEIKDKIDGATENNFGVYVTDRCDGFEVCGCRFIDPEGEILSYKCNQLTGDVTYLVVDYSGEVIIKWQRIAASTEPLVIAKAKRNNGRWFIETSTGKKINGVSLAPFSKGFLVGRNETGFIYKPGEGIVSFSVPEGFRIANYQNGDISETDYILCEKIYRKNKNDISTLFSEIKALGSTVGVTEKCDYLLFNIRSGKSIPINASVEDNSVAVHTGKRKRNANALIVECPEVNFFNSLYDEYGQINSGHYYWRINWFETASGPLLITRESGKPRVTVFNLLTDEKKIILERLLGINWFKADRQPDGKIKIIAKLGLEIQTIDDVEKTIEKI